MGYDITYHPIKVEQMEKWYFNRLDEVKSGNHSKVREIAKEAGIEEFYIEKYVDVMKIAADAKTDEIFEKTHGFNIAVIQGFFLPYYYNRGTGFSFLIADHPEMTKYITPWKDIIPQTIKSPIQGYIFENYCGGVFIAPDQVNQLLSDYEKDEHIKKIIDEFFEINLPVFFTALEYASENGLGLVEATEVVEPNPIDLNQTQSYSNLYNCDPEGALIYHEVTLKQVEEFLKEKGDNTDLKEALKNAVYKKIEYSSQDKEHKKGGFFRRLFKK